MKMFLMFAPYVTTYPMMSPTINQFNCPINLTTPTPKDKPKDVANFLQLS